MRKFAVLFTTILILSGQSFADEVKILEVKVSSGGNGYRFDVTLEHADTGWDHYADLWEVVLEDDTVLGSRVLHHPHVNEQPFTRSLSAVKVPEGISHVFIRARDSVHGFAKQRFKVDLTE